MARSRSARDRVATELAALTGQTPAELKVVLGVTAAAAGVVVLLRILRALFDMEFGDSSRTRRS